MSKLKVSDRVRWVDYAPTKEVGETAYVLFDGKTKVEPVSITALETEAAQ